ncbi:hypothetical protein ABR26_10500, partial [Enterobacter bugandensis]
PLTPALSLKGEGVVRAGIILWGSLSPQGEGEHPFRNSCSFVSRFLILTLITIILTACDERFPHE